MPRAGLSKSSRAVRAAFVRSLALCGCLFASTQLEAADCEDFTPFGRPVHRSILADAGVAQPPDWTIICHTGQVVAFNPARNVSDWAAYTLTRVQLLNPQTKRKENFRADTEVPARHQVTELDYKYTGYDRGHLAPAGAMLWSARAMNDSFLMTNIAPQTGVRFNRHIWKSLEVRMRRWACARTTLHVVTGPLYENNPVLQLIYDEDGDEEDDNGILVDVPTHFFKAAFDPLRVEAIAFILENRQLETKNLHKYLVSVDEVETRSRLDILPNLWDSAESAVESHVQPALWEKPGGECGSRVQ